jgi:hypothetical protein
VAASTPVSVSAAKPIGRAGHQEASLEQVAPRDSAFQYLAAISTAGAIVIVRSPQLAGSDAIKLTQGRVLLASSPAALSSPQLLPLGPPRKHPQQVTDVVVNDRWVVWVETPSTDLNVNPWVMYAYDRSTGQTQRMAAAPRMTDGPPLSPPGWAGPSLSGNSVVWSETTGSTKAPHSDVVGCSLPTCSHRRVLLTGAAFPVATTNGVYAVRAPGYAGKGDFRQLSVVHRDFDGGTVEVVRRVTLPPKAALTGFTANSSDQAWTVTGKGLTTVTLATSGHPITIQGLAREIFSSPNLSSTDLTWAESSGSGAANVGGYLYVLRDGRLYSLGNASGLYSVISAGLYFSWQQAATAGDGNSAITDVLAKIRPSD